MDKPSVDLIVATERKRYRRRMVWSLVGIAVGIAGGVLTALSEHHYPLPRLLVDHPPIAILAGALLGLAITIAAWMLNPQPEGADADAVTQCQIETYQNRYRWWVLFIGFMPLFLATVYFVLPDYWPGYFHTIPASYRLFVVTVLCTTPFIAFEVFRPTADTPTNFNDELLRDIRLKAVRIGYVAVVAALTAAYVWLLWHPTDVLAILPWILAGGVAIPAVAFVFLHWQAGREA